MRVLVNNAKCLVVRTSSGRPNSKKSRFHSDCLSFRDDMLSLFDPLRNTVVTEAIHHGCKTTILLRSIEILMTSGSVCNEFLEAIQSINNQPSMGLKEGIPTGIGVYPTKIEVLHSINKSSIVDCLNDGTTLFVIVEQMLLCIGVWDRRWRDIAIASRKPTSKIANAILA
jgi:hypothetical protein